MYSTKLALAAENVLIDQWTGSRSVINVFEEIVGFQFPFALARLNFYFTLKRGPDDAEAVNLIFRVVTAETEVFRQPITIQFFNNSELAQGSLNVSGLTVPQPGNVEFELMTTDGQQVGGYSFAVQPPPVKANLASQQPTLPTISPTIVTKPQ